MGQIIAILTQLLPLISYAPDMIASIKSMIISLQTSGNATADELSQLKDLDAKCDAAFEATAVAAGAAPEA